MKQILFLLMLSISISTVYGQDKIIKLSGDTITCKVKEITDDNIKYSYEGEDLINNIHQNVVKEIIFKSGRTQKFSERVIVNSEEDWEKVKITTLESDITGLVKGEDIMAKASSGWSTTNQGKMQMKAMDKLKKQAAAKGYHIVLLITTTGTGGHYGISGGTKASVTGVGYKYE
ncbi:hypothetical protein K8352_16160 [Flavobacteriaceae bacterium F89]|uniref:Uncharacterized protein n=1 Tax=Cerina litoralis TaxID=2874477 RepID=A0AAE3EZ11_9FLAO|nr:hypothetical protein [Cerina litoralis]MCG2462296.1 hypothetical protein [Cerina litoralis]